MVLTGPSIEFSIGSTATSAMPVSTADVSAGMLEKAEELGIGAAVEDGGIFAVGSTRSQEGNRHALHPVTWGRLRGPPATLVESYPTSPR